MYMSWRQVKKVPPSKINVGDVVESYIQDGMHHSVSDGWLIVNKTGAAITLQFQRGEPTQTTLSTEDLMFEVPLTEEEYRDKYEAKAQEIMQALTAEPLPSLSWDNHTMDNSWTDIDIWDFAANCTENHIRVIGWFPLESSKRTWMGDELDIGIIAEDMDITGEIFWTHYKKDWVEDMIEWHDAIREETQKRRKMNEQRKEIIG